MLERASHLIGRRVALRRSSAHNRVLEVVQVGERRVLDAESVNYSFGNLHKVFEDAFRALGLERRRIGRALLLGCGAGSVVALLRGLPRPPSAIVAVEIDPVVVALAREHFGLAPSADLEIVVADAADFVARPAQPFDLAVVDVFLDAEIPAQCQTPAFLRDCLRLLAPGGLLVFNRLAHTSAERARTEHFASVFQDACGETRAVDVGDNLLLVHEAGERKP